MENRKPTESNNNGCEPATVGKYTEASIISYVYNR